MTTKIECFKAYDIRGQIPDQLNDDIAYRIGNAWDGDFDRCFLFDEKGDFIEGYCIVGLLAESRLAANPSARLVHGYRCRVPIAAVDSG